MLRRLLLPIVLVVGALLAQASSAAASPPVIDRPGVVDVEFDFSGACAFDLHVRLVYHTQTIAFVRSDGSAIRAISTGRLEQWITNLETGTTIHQVIPGPSFFDSNGVLVRGAGPWSGIFKDGVLISAWGNITFAPDGSVVSVRGRIVDVCAQLS